MLPESENDYLLTSVMSNTVGIVDNTHTMLMKSENYPFASATVASTSTFISQSTYSILPSSSSTTSFALAAHKARSFFKKTSHDDESVTITSFSPRGYYAIPRLLSTVPMVLHLYLTTFTVLSVILTFNTANGYVVGRLLDLQEDNPSPTQKYLIESKHSTNNISPKTIELLLTERRKQSSSTPTLDSFFSSVTPEMISILYNTLTDDQLQEHNSPSQRRNSRRYNRQRRYGGSNAEEPKSTSAEIRRASYPRFHVKRTVSDSQKKKKSQLKSLKKFSGNNSRNCFFTPIQCMIQQDLTKYMNKYTSSSDGSTTIGF